MGDTEYTLDNLLSQRERMYQVKRVGDNPNSRREFIDIQKTSPIPADSPKIKLLYRHGVLDRILSYINDPMDVIAAYNACSAFHEILEPKNNALKKQEEVFHIVFKAVFRKAYERRTFDLRYILNLRRVSKFMRKVVDKYLFEKPFLDEITVDDWEFDFRTKFGHGNHVLMVTLKFEELYQVHRAMTVLSGCSDKQCFRRVLEVCERPGKRPGDLKEFRSAVLEFLRRYGTSIWCFFLDPYHTKVADTYQTMCTLCNLMPNLKGFYGSVHYASSSETQEVPALEQKIASVPFPSIHSLLFCNIIPSLPIVRPRIMAEVIKTNPWIKRATLDWNSGTAMELVDLAAPFKPTQVCIRADHIPPELTAATWPLKKLELSLVSWFGQTQRTTILFPILEKFKKTLTHLDLRGVDLHEDGNDPSAPTLLNLPLMKALFIKLTGEFHKLDFMLLMKSLEILLLNCDPKVLYRGIELEMENRRRLFTLDESEKIKCKGFLHRMEHSNIAKVFPTLRQLQILSLVPKQYSPFTYKRDKESNSMKPDKKSMKLMDELTSEISKYSN